MLALLVTLCLGITVYGNEDVLGDGLRTYRIYDLDFENTKVHKVCLLAEFNATIKITHHRNEYIIPIPQDATTDGSFCDRNYKSELLLKFDDTLVTMTFHRNTQHPSLPKTSYCDKCDYGTWNMNRLTVSTHIEPYYVQAALIPENLKSYSKDLYEGINIKRAYQCIREDHSNTTIRLEKVTAWMNESEILPDRWKAEIQFQLIQIQPFLVFKTYFDDPYLCSDITASLLLVILLPIIYFTIFILFYRIKGRFGCPPCPNRTGKHRLDSDTSETNLKEESTVMVSGFSSTRLTSDIYSDSAFCWLYACNANICSVHIWMNSISNFNFWRLATIWLKANHYRL